MSERFLCVHAVEDTSVQLTWTGLPARRVIVGVGPRSIIVEGQAPAFRHHGLFGARPMSKRPTGPGAVVVEGLEAGATYPVWWREPGRARVTEGAVTTLRPPPGRLLTRFATISDLHVGERRFGVAGSILDRPPPGEAPFPERCARAAIDEARAWGATTLVVKGDLTGRGRPAEVATVARLLAGSRMDTLVQLGNHDVNGPLDLARLGPEATVAHDGRIVVADLPGVRVVLGDSPVPGLHRGRLGAGQLDTIVDAVADAGGPAVLMLHHPPQAWPVPVFYPPGLERDDSRKLLAGLRGANPATIVMAGHSHRNRTYRIDGVLVAEVGSTKDYPGGWAGYAVYEGGIRQVVRRTARPDVIAWTAATAGALGGLWGWWAPGGPTDRSWSRTWDEVTTGPSLLARLVAKR